MRKIIRWISERWPHLDIKRNPWGRNESDLIVRLYGLRPLNRLCLIDYTRARFSSARPSWSRLRVLGWTVFEVNEELSGLQGRASAKWQGKTIRIAGVML
jgi:hypothetical protein